MKKPAIAKANGYKPNSAGHEALKVMARGPELVFVVDAHSKYVSDVWINYMKDFVMRGLAVISKPEGSRANLAFRSHIIELTEDGKTLVEWLDYYADDYQTRTEINRLNDIIKTFGGKQETMIDVACAYFHLRSHSVTTERSKAEKTKLLAFLAEKVATFSTESIIADIEGAQYGRKHRLEMIDFLRNNGIKFEDDARLIELAFIAAKLTYGTN